MSKVFDGTTQEGREAIGYASILTDKQADTETEAQVAALKGSKATCSDCGGVFAITELDGSTALCGVCYEVAGLENELQDGYITEAEFDEKAAALGYKGSA